MKKRLPRRLRFRAPADGTAERACYGCEAQILEPPRLACLGGSFSSCRIRGGASPHEWLPKAVGYFFFFADFFFPPFFAAFLAFFLAFFLATVRPP